MNYPSYLPWLALALLVPAHGLQIRSYDAGIHDRFSSGFPNTPVMNPNFLHDASKFTGVGWWYQSGDPAASHIQFTLITPRHAMSVHHLSGQFPPGARSARFLASDGQTHTRVISLFTSIPNGSGGYADLGILTFSNVLPATVKPVRWLNLPDESDYVDLSIGVLGFVARGAQAKIASFHTIDGGSAFNPTRMYRFPYNTILGDGNDCHFQVGDSGSPTFIDVNGEPAVVGLNSWVDTSTNPLIYQNYSTFLKPYIPAIDAILEPSGYRVRPAHYTPTTLGLSSASSPGILRQAHPASLTFTLGNTGSETTGNAELTLSFAPEEAPAFISAPGWVVEPMGGGVWSIRKAVMPSSDSIVATATWTSLPAVASMEVGVTVTSDTTTAMSTQPSFTLLPSYAAWAAVLSEAEETDDPDEDGLENLLEYAFGGEAESGVMLLPGGHALQPSLSVSGGIITLSYPERSDAIARGLSYTVETSTGLDDLAGSTTLPAGAASSTAAYSPAEPGFVKRTITWPSDGPLRFARVKVALAE